MVFARRGVVKASLYDFWNHVRDANPDVPGSCWTWFGATDAAGYPMYCGVYARRISALIDTGSIPGNVSMQCVNQRCVRPSHIFSIGLPGRKSRKTGKIPLRHNQEFLLKVYQLREHTDVEIAAKLDTLPNIVRHARVQFAMFRILDEIAWCKANKKHILREPVGQSIDANTLFDSIKPLEQAPLEKPT